MLKLNPQFLKRGKKTEYVVLSMKEFKAIQERLEDADDLLAIRNAKRRDKGGPGVPHDQVMRRFGLKA